MIKKMRKTEELSDHDLLITLKANFDSFATQYTLDMRELKDGTTTKLSDHELRIAAIEKGGSEYNAKELVSELHGNTEWIKQYKVTNRVIIAALSFISLVGGIIGTMIAVSSGLVSLGG